MYWGMGIRGGDGGEVCVLRDNVEPDKLPDGTAAGVDGGGRGQRERVVGRRVHARARRRSRRRLLARPIPHRPLLLLPLLPGTFTQPPLISFNPVLFF